MARIRSIKPEFWDSPDTARASMAARLLYIAMWNWADDWGIGSANMKALAAFAFPNDDDITASELPTLAKEVADCFGVTFYEVDGRPYYTIPSWDKHQRTERKARRTNPPPPDDEPAGQAAVTEVPTLSVGRTLQSVGNPQDGTGEQGKGNRGKVPTTSGAENAEQITPTSQPPDDPVAAVVAAYVTGATESGLPRPERSLCARVGKQAKAMLARHPADHLRTAAYAAGAGGWTDIAVQLQRDAVRNRGSTADQRVADGASLIAKYAAEGR